MSSKGKGRAAREASVSPSRSPSPAKSRSSRSNKGSSRKRPAGHRRGSVGSDDESTSRRGRRHVEAADDSGSENDRGSDDESEVSEAEARAPRKRARHSSGGGRSSTTSRSRGSGSRKASSKKSGSKKKSASKKKKASGKRRSSSSRSRSRSGRSGGRTVPAHHLPPHHPDYVMKIPEFRKKARWATDPLGVTRPITVSLRDNKRDSPQKRQMRANFAHVKFDDLKIMPMENVREILAHVTEPRMFVIKRALNNFMQFSQGERKKKGESKGDGKIQTTLSKSWKKMSKDEKKPYTQSYMDDKSEHDDLVEAHKPPKRYLAAWGVFQAEYRAKVEKNVADRARNPSIKELHSADVAYMSKLWNELKSNAEEKKDPAAIAEMKRLEDLSKLSYCKYIVESTEYTKKIDAYLASVLAHDKKASLERAARDKKEGIDSAYTRVSKRSSRSSKGSSRKGTGGKRSSGGGSRKSTGGSKRASRKGASGGGSDDEGDKSDAPAEGGESKHESKHGDSSSSGASGAGSSESAARSKDKEAPASSSASSSSHKGASSSGSSRSRRAHSDELVA